MAEVYGGTEAKNRERAEHEKNEEEKNREKTEKNKKVKERKELFERIAERKKYETDQDLAKKRKVLKFERGGGRQRE